MHGARAWKRAATILLGAGAAVLIAVGAARTRRPRENTALARVRELQRVQAREEGRLRGRVSAAPGDPVPRLELVEFLLDQRRTGDALDEARAAHAAFPEHAPATESLAEALLSGARTREAIDLLRPLAGRDAEYRVELARALVRDGNTEEAVRVLKPVSAGNPSLALRAGVVYLDARRPAAAVPLLQAAVRSQPHQLDPHSYLGFSLLTSGRYAEAARALADAVAIAPNVPVLHYYRGSALRLSGVLDRLPEAQEELRRAVDLAPRDGLFQYELALALAQLRQWDAAESALEQAAALSPETPEIQRDLARVYHRQKRSTQEAMAQARYLKLMDDAPAAIRVLEPWFRKDPSNVDLALQMSVIYYAASRFEPAVRVLESLRPKESSNPRVLWSLFRLQFALRHYGQAEAVLNELDRLLPQDISVLEEREKLYETLSRNAEAEALLTRLRDREPADAQRQYALARFISLWSQRPDKSRAAETDFRKALELRPEFPSALYELGVLQDNSGRSREALGYLRRAADLEPGFGDVQRALGRAYRELGDRTRSDECLRLYNELKARADRRTALELPVEHGRELRRSRADLAELQLRSGDYAAAIRQLEMLEHGFPNDRTVHSQLAALYGQAKRFQRQFEERRLGL